MVYEAVCAADGLVKLCAEVCGFPTIGEIVSAVSLTGSCSTFEASSPENLTDIP